MHCFHLFTRKAAQLKPMKKHASPAQHRHHLLDFAVPILLKSQRQFARATSSLVHTLEQDESTNT